jgi:hypothetical protein
MHRIALAIASLFGIVLASPALANGEIVITQAKVYAGNITPGDPPGFPVVITQPGAYVLESNLTVPAGNYGFAINAHNVDLDMNGFTLSGNGTATYGIFSSFGESRIHGGIINRFAYSGIHVRNNAWVIEDMQIVRNGSVGIDATSTYYLTVRHSIIAANGGHGIYTGDDARIERNTISRNGSGGILCLKGCYVEANSLRANTGRAVRTETGLLVGNLISESGDHALWDNGTINTGLANNMFIDNNPTGAANEQNVGGLDVHPNTCAGKPC